MSAMASQITSLTIVYSTVYPDADQRKRQRSASVAFVRGIHRWPMNSNSLHKEPITRKMFPFDDAIMDNHAPWSLINLPIWTFECFMIIVFQNLPIRSNKRDFILNSPELIEE